jgi:excisionase family DNA binding protein
MIEQNEKWINIDEAAEYSGVKPRTVRDRIRKEKSVPAHKIGKQWKFKCVELDDWVKSGKSAESAESAIK